MSKPAPASAEPFLPPPPIGTGFHETAKGAFDRVQKEFDDVTARRIDALKAFAGDGVIDAIDTEIRHKQRAVDRARERLDAADAEKERLEQEAAAMATIWREKYPIWRENAERYVAALDAALAAQTDFIKSASELHQLFDGCSHIVQGGNDDVLSAEFVAGVKHDVRAAFDAYRRYSAGCAATVKEHAQ